jgi:Amt family ammonium transporter
MVVAWLKFGKPEVGMTLNGALAGLVAITAGCANLTPTFAVVDGAIAGFLVVMAVLFFDRIGVDDPVGAVSVHGVCGAWGTLAAGLFNAEKMFDPHIVGVQALGVVCCFAWTFITAYTLFRIINATIGLRVSPEEEYEGLDFSEHGGDAYPDFGRTVGSSLGHLPPSGGHGAPQPAAAMSSMAMAEAR